MVTCCGASACGVVVDEQRSQMDGGSTARSFPAPVLAASHAADAARRWCGGRAATMRLLWQPRMALMGPAHLARSQVVREADGYQAPVQAASHATYP